MVITVSTERESTDWIDEDIIIISITDKYRRQKITLVSRALQHGTATLHFSYDWWGTHDGYWISHLTLQIFTVTFIWNIEYKK